MAGLFIPWRLLYPMVRDLFSNLKDQLPRNGISRYEKSMEDVYSQPFLGGLPLQEVYNHHIARFYFLKTIILKLELAILFS